MRTESRNPTQIVILDDDDSLLDLMREILESEGGYRVQIRAEGQGGYEFVKQVLPDLVILDLVFAREQLGWTILETLKADPETLVVNIVPSPTEAQLESEVDAEAAGVVETPPSDQSES